MRSSLHLLGIGLRQRWVALRVMLGIWLALCSGAAAQGAPPAPPPAPAAQSAQPLPSGSPVVESVDVAMDDDLARLPQAQLQALVEQLRVQITSYQSQLDWLQDNERHLPKEATEVCKAVTIPDGDCRDEGVRNAWDKASGDLEAELNQLRVPTDNFRSRSVFARDNLRFRMRPALDEPDPQQRCSALSKQLPAWLQECAALNPMSKAELDADRKSNSGEIEYFQKKLAATKKRLAFALEAAKKGDRSQTIISSLPLLVIILGVFSLAIMVMVRRFKEPIQRNWVESGQVIQFMTVTILVNVILVLGLAEILGGETLGTLLGGIAGYMLSQGVARAATGTRVTPQTNVQETR